MANNLSFSVDLNTKGYQTGAKEAEESNKRLKQSLLDNFNSLGSLKKQLMTAKREAQNLAGAFAQLSETEKKSEVGKQMAKDLDEAIRKASVLQDSLDDVNEQIKNMASDTADLEAFKEGLDLAKSVTVGLTGAFTELTGSEEEAAKLLKTLTTVTSAYNAAIKVTTMLQANSKTMTALVNNGVISLTTATRVQTVATKGLGVAMKALPWVALAAGAIAAGKAIYNYATAAESAKEKEERLAKEEEKRQQKLESLKNIQNSYVNTLTSSYGNLMQSYNKLKLSWKQLSTEQEKVKWIKENKSKLAELGIEVNKVKDAEEAFVTNTSSVVDGFRKRAQMAALAAQAVQLYTKTMEIEQKATERFNKIKVKAGDKDLSSSHTLDANGKTYNNGTAVLDNGVYKLTEEGARKVNQQLFEQDKTLKELSDEYKDINKQLDSNLNKQEQISRSIKSISSNSGKTGDSDKPKKVLTVLEKLEDKVKECQKELGNIDLEAPNAEETIKIAQENLKKAQDAVKNYKIKVGIEIPKEEVDKAAEKAKQELEKELSSISDITKELNKPQDKKYDFSFLPENFQSDADNALERLNKIKDAREKYQKIIDSSKNDAAIQKANEALAQTNDEYTKLIAKVEKYNSLSSQIGKHAKGIEKINDAMGSISNVAGSIDGVVNSFESLGNAFKEGANGWEIFMGLLQTGISIMNAVTTVMTVINTIQDLMNVKKAVGNSAIMQEAAGNEANVIAQTQEIGTTSSLIGVQAAAIPITLALATAYKQLAAAQIFAAHAYIPFAGVAIASGQIAAMEAVFASLLAFEQGGVVPGNSFTGDKMLIRANSGERVLTAKQNENIEKIASGVVGNGLSSNTIHVEGRISGKDLLLVQKNYNTVSPRGQKITF